MHLELFKMPRCGMNELLFERPKQRAYDPSQSRGRKKGFSLPAVPSSRLRCVVVHLRTPLVFHVHHVELKDVRPAVEKAPNGGDGPSKIAVDEFLDVGAFREVARREKAGKREKKAWLANEKQAGGRRNRRLGQSTRSDYARKGA